MKFGLWIGYTLCALILLSACLIPWVTRQMYMTAMAKLDNPSRQFQPGSASGTSADNKPKPTKTPEDEPFPELTEPPAEADILVPELPFEPELPSLPPMISFTPRESGDFLADEARFKQFTELVYAYRFDDVKELVDAYISDIAPPKTDSAFEIADVLQTFNAVALLAKCTAADADPESPSPGEPADGALVPQYLFYSGVTSLSSGMALVPYLSTESGAFLRVGYLSSKNVIYGGYTLTDDGGVAATGPLPGWDLEDMKDAPATVPAAADIPISLGDKPYNDARIESLLASGKITLRYTVDGQAVKSYTATAKEKEALSAIYTLCRTQAMLLGIAAGEPV